MPPVSTTSNGTPRHSACCAMTSRVVPAIGVTIARRVPVMRLNSVDLPTFGRPTRTTEGSFLATGTRGHGGNLITGSVPPRLRGFYFWLKLIGPVGIAEPDANGTTVWKRELLDEGER